MYINKKNINPLYQFYELFIIYKIDYHSYTKVFTKIVILIHR